MKKPRLKWAPIIEEARVWVQAQAPRPVTLRQCFYYLVTVEKLENTERCYKRLSELTGKGRYARTFPPFVDETRIMDERPSWDRMSDFARDAAGWFGLDRTEGQKYQVVVAVEKRGMHPAISRLFRERGWRLVALGGYASVTLKQDLSQFLEKDPHHRPSILLYAGDLDASGEDILRDFAGDWDGSGAPSDHPVHFDRVIKVALTVDQVLERGLPHMAVGKTDKEGKAKDTRAARFSRKYRDFIDSGQFGENFQVEVDALPPADLDQLFLEAAAPYWDESQFNEVVRREDVLRRAFAAGAAEVARVIDDES